MGGNSSKEVNNSSIIESKICSSNDDTLTEELFKQPPPEEDCPICFLRLPTLESGSIHYTCCGKVICSGCAYAADKIGAGDMCPFCRDSLSTPIPKSAKAKVKMIEKRVKVGDANAIYTLGLYYRDGIFGIIQNHTKALELWHRAGDLGHAKAYNCIGYAYQHGRGVEVDMKKAMYYWELAAIRGDVSARYNLGVREEYNGKLWLGLKHHMIAARSGESDSLKHIQYMYSNGHATKDNYTEALRAYQTYLLEIKSMQRDEAAAFDDRLRYY